MPKIAFDQLRDSLEGAREVDCVEAAIREFAHQLDFEWFAYLSVCGPEIDTFSNYPLAWQSNYIAKRYAAIDPVVQASRRSQSGFSWSEEMLAPQSSPDQVHFLVEAKDHGIVSGVSVPVPAGFGRTALFTLASSSQHNDRLLEHPLMATAIATHVDVCARRCMREPQGFLPVKLSPKECVCLSWAAKGKSMSETAQIIGTKPRTVEFHLQNAKRKLDATNITHAVALAMRQQLI